MNQKPTKDKRKHIRIPLLAESCTWTEYTDAYAIDRVVEMKDITVGGVFLKSNDLPKAQSYVMIKFEMPGQLGSITVKGKVVRMRWIETKNIGEPKGFGVEFLEQTPGSAKILDAYVTYLRNKQIITVSKRIIEEFFGSRGPKEPTT